MKKFENVNLSKLRHDKTAKVFIFLKNLVKFVFNIVVFYVISIFFKNIVNDS